VLTRPEFDAAHHQAGEWFPGPDAIDPDRAALAEVAEWLWRDGWNGERRQSGRDRLLRRVGSRSVLVLTRASPERLAVLLAAPSFLASRWLKEIRDASASAGIDFALTDADAPVLGATDVPLARQSMRPSSTTQLPWTMHAISADPGLELRGLSGSTTLLLAGTAMMVLLVVAVGVFINRTVARELTVARQQADFVAAVSHEFRTPLTTIRQLSEMLVRGRISGDVRRHQFYETLLRESDRLHKLVEGVLDFKRFDAGGSAYRFETVDAGELVRGIVAEFETRVAPQGFRVELRALEGDLRIQADRDALTRAIWNLLDNALKYSAECRVIWVDLRKEGGRVAIAVRDQGLGIPAREREAIFDRFVRGAESKARHIAGTGIGLAMVKTIVQAHGGEIRLASEPGQGSQFTMVLRAAESAP
jgi:signal transduction histidine kinase